MLFVSPELLGAVSVAVIGIFSALVGMIHRSSVKRIDDLESCSLGVTERMARIETDLQHVKNSVSSLPDMDRRLQAIEDKVSFVFNDVKKNGRKS